VVIHSVLEGAYWRGVIFLHQKMQMAQRVSFFSRDTTLVLKEV
jgi:hypothetical protein